MKEVDRLLNKDKGFLTEAKILKTFSKDVGFPKFYKLISTQDKRYIVMELLGENLFKIMEEKEVFNLETIC